MIAIKFAKTTGGRIEAYVVGSKYETHAQILRSSGTEESARRDVIKLLRDTANRMESDLQTYGQI